MGRFSSLEGQKDQLFRRAVADKQALYSISQLQGGGVSAGTQSINSMLRYNIVRPFADRTTLGVKHETAIIANDVILQVSRAIGREANRAMLTFAENTQKQVSQRQGLTRLHQRVANEARQAVLVNYHRKVQEGTSYRGNGGRLSGRMEAALNNSDVIRSQRDGILYMNTAVLDRVAAHWRRLNYGAGRAGRTGGGNQPAPLMYNGKQIGRLRLTSPPSPAFSLPFGVWLNGTGHIVPFKLGLKGYGTRGDQFWLFRQAKTNPSVIAKLKELSGNRHQARLHQATLASGQLKNNPSARAELRQKVADLRASEKWVGSTKETRGIQGYHFFDAGLRVMGAVLPDAYAQIGRAWMEEASTGIRTPLRRIAVN